MKTDFFKKNKKILMITVACVLVVCVGIAVIGANLSDGNGYGNMEEKLGDVICNGVSVGGIQVGGMTKAEAKETLSTKGVVTAEIKFEFEDKTFNIKAETINLDARIDDAVERAYAIGRSDDKKQNKKDVEKAEISGINITPEVSYDKEKLLLAIDENMADELTDPAPMGVEVGDSCLVVTNAQPGVVLDAENTCKNFEKVIGNFSGDKTVEVMVLKEETEDMTFKEFADKYRKKPTNAKYDPATGVITPEVNGIDFDDDEVKKILEENKDNKESYRIPAKVVIPDVTARELEDRYINKIVSRFSTSFSGSSDARITNITLAASKMDGYVISPGESFSYNAVVGPRTEAAGFRKAQSYAGTQVVEDVGGGICQVSTTLYNAVVLADLEVTVRSGHSMPVSYVPLGRDAAVAYGILDFCFRNNKPYPISIDTSVSGATLTVAIVGSSEKDYTVEFVSSQTGTIPYSSSTVEDPNLPAGETKVISYGSNGSTHESYRVYKRNGVEYDRKFEAKTRYQPVPEKIAVGTGAQVAEEIK